MSYLSSDLSGLTQEHLADAAQSIAKAVDRAIMGRIHSMFIVGPRFEQHLTYSVTTQQERFISEAWAREGLATLLEQSPMAFAIRDFEGFPKAKDKVNVCRSKMTT